MLAVAIMGPALVACSSDESGSTSTTSGTTTSSVTSTSSNSTTSTAPGTSSSSTSRPGAGAYDVTRVRLGNVSAYILVNGGVASLVDTGNPGSEDAIESALSEIGLGWNDVSDIIVTHRHPDHQGSIGAVMDRATEATGYVGEPDLPSVATSAPRPLSVVADMNTVNDLVVVATPGHTPGHMSVYDPIGGALIAGDSLNGDSEGLVVTGANPRFSDDMAQAAESVRKLATLNPTAIYFGHGEPLLVDAAGKLAELAQSL